MKNGFKKAARNGRELVGDVVKVLGLAVQIDKKLVVKYYSTAAVGAIAPVVAAYLFKMLIDSISGGINIGAGDIVPVAVIIVLAAYFFMGLAETVVYWGMNVSYYDYLLRNRLQAGLAYRYAQKLSSLDVQHLEDPETQTLITKVEETYQWQVPDFLRMFGYFFINIVSIVSIVLVLLPIAWWMPFVILALAAPRMYLKLKQGNFTWAMFGGSAPEAKKLWYLSALLGARESILEMRVFRSQRALLDKMQKVHEHLYKVNKKPLDRYIWVLIIAPIIEVGVMFGMVYFLLPGVAHGTMTIGTIALVITTLWQLRAQTSQLSSNLGELHQHSLFVKPFFQLLDLPRIIKTSKKPVKFDQITSPKIEFKNVSFNYPSGHKVLDNISFVVNPGESLALVGVNGAGKSTIIKLLCRFYDVTSGEILINGVNIKQLDLDNWYRHMGTLFQDFVKYNFSVRDNIQLGAPDIKDDDRMVRAAQKSGADKFIEDLPDKYDQMLGYRFGAGVELSGGQWQKLAVARAFYQQAPILIMDEPTSAIDAGSELEIFENLRELYKNKTLILVSHRFSTVRNADKIVVIDSGHIVESGSHDELITRGSVYAELFNAQAVGYV
jgi:ATP-binding cassette subfamily B protein